MQLLFQGIHDKPILHYQHLMFLIVYPNRQREQTLQM